MEQERVNSFELNLKSFFPFYLVWLNSIRWDKIHQIQIKSTSRAASIICCFRIKQIWRWAKTILFREYHLKLLELHQCVFSFFGWKYTMKKRAKWFSTWLFWCLLEEFLESVHKFLQHQNCCSFFLTSLQCKWRTWLLHLSIDPEKPAF